MLQSKGEKRFKVFNNILMGIFGICFIFPVLFVLKTALDIAPMTIDFAFWPRDPSLIFFKLVVTDSSIYRPFLNSIFITVVGTTLSTIFQCLGGYAMSKRDMPGMNAIVVFLIIIPMFLGGGLVPSYILYKTIGFLDTYYVMILPGMISAMNIIIIRNYFWTLPKSLIEAAKIDGAGEFTVFRRIMLPLSKSVISATTLFTGVGYWNTFMSAIYFVTSAEKKPFTVKLFSVIDRRDSTLSATLSHALQEIGKTELAGNINQDAIGAAITLVSIIPIIILYPFMQKYFAAGMLKGSIKG